MRGGLYIQTRRKRSRRKERFCVAMSKLLDNGQRIAIDLKPATGSVRQIRRD